MWKVVYKYSKIHRHFTFFFNSQLLDKNKIELILLKTNLGGVTNNIDFELRL